MLAAVLVIGRCARRRSILCLLLLLMVADALRHVLLEQQGRRVSTLISAASGGVESETGVPSSLVRHGEE